jgi:hypothetical protein
MSEELRCTKCKVHFVKSKNEERICTYCRKAEKEKCKRCGEITLRTTNTADICFKCKLEENNKIQCKSCLKFCVHKSKSNVGICSSCKNAVTSKKCGVDGCNVKLRNGYEQIGFCRSHALVKKCENCNCKLNNAFEILNGKCKFCC